MMLVEGEITSQREEKNKWKKGRKGNNNKVESCRLNYAKRYRRVRHIGRASFHLRYQPDILF